MIQAVFRENGRQAILFLVLLFVSAILVPSCNLGSGPGNSGDRPTAGAYERASEPDTASLLFWQEKVSEFRDLLASSDWWIEANFHGPNARRPEIYDHYGVSPAAIPDPELFKQAFEQRKREMAETEKEFQSKVGSWYQLTWDWPDREYTPEEKFLIAGGRLFIDKDRDGRADLEIRAMASPFTDVPYFLRDVGRYPTSAIELMAKLYPKERYQDRSEEEIYRVVAGYLNPFTGKLRRFFCDSREPADPQPGDVFMHRLTPGEMEALGIDTSGPDPYSPPDEQPSKFVWYYKLYGWNGLILDLKPFIQFNSKLGL